MDRERALPDHTVIVRGERIEAIGPSAKVQVPVGATRIDGRGKFLLPGMAEMHAHIPNWSLGGHLLHRFRDAQHGVVVERRAHRDWAGRGGLVR